MKKISINLVVLIASLVAVLIAGASYASESYSNYTSSNAGLYSNATNELSDAEIISEYKTIRAKRRDGYYGSTVSNGAQLMRGYEITIANYLSVKIKAQTCQELQRRIPSLDTGYYIFPIKQASRYSWFRSKKVPQLTSKRCTSVGSMMAIVTSTLL